VGVVCVTMAPDDDEVVHGRIRPCRWPMSDRVDFPRAAEYASALRWPVPAIPYNPSPHTSYVRDVECCEAGGS
jgi:hypothetical protein